MKSIFFEEKDLEEAGILVFPVIVKNPYFIVRVFDRRMLVGASVKVTTDRMEIYPVVSHVDPSLVEKLVDLVGDLIEKP